MQLKNSGVVFAISMILLVVCISSCSKDPIESHFSVRLPNGAQIAHYENRSGFADASHIMVLSYNEDNVPDLLIRDFKLEKFVSRNGATAGVVSSEWPCWWQPEVICRIADVYERIGINSFAWLWFDRENREIYVQWGTH